ncbi:SelT/SelW/SelH family protein [Cobetia marina]|jgi:selenoprotein W-related protein|uniref:SelT/SelW/SelH family protein n=1 Tax=Cobetia marina TaxID=28258 RepID=A0ABU9GGM4_COBMA|nr:MULTISPECIES: SelT/SelW/SelH family protein [Cobetia]AOM00648.1 selenoprotein W-like protein [Cobetia marina]MDA5562551.1 SelT/SelW/SelH family protein [Cobetia sp. MMG027]MDH2291072.1 SelT/SelW/SelH family protein [Cobetia sp. 10Alg 146]MDH2372997.1 SelT/SelW/SelH family protein [Cobetia sp. 3AK]MDI6002777.1 SelT/SelW/SelH family protein [Cobetia pacifica]
MDQPSTLKIRIHYCTGCNWLLRAAWYAQELLSTFGEALDEVALAPSHGGHFEVLCQPAPDAEWQVLWERKRDGGFPDSRDLKQRVRDVLDPERDLGHIDRASREQGTPTP